MHTSFFTIISTFILSVSIHYILILTKQIICNITYFNKTDILIHYLIFGALNTADAQIESINNIGIMINRIEFNILLEIAFSLFVNSKKTNGKIGNKTIEQSINPIIPYELICL